MKAMINKDIKAYGLLMLGIFIIVLLYCYLCVRLGSIKGILGLTVIMIPAIVSIVVFIGDHQMHHLLLSMPVSRKSFVISKYVSTCLFSALIIGLSVLILFILSTVYVDAKGELSRLISLRGLLFCMTPVTLIVSICYPLLFRYGLKIGVRVVMSVFALLYGLGMVAAEKIIQSHFLVPGGGIFNAYIGLLNHFDSLGNLFYFTLILILMLLLVISTFISIHSIKKKDIQ